jgi:hypothetical protein
MGTHGSSYRRIPFLRKFTTFEEMIEIARQECKNQGWPWLEPIEIERKAFTSIVTGASDGSGRRVRIVIRCTTGEVLCKSFIRRALPSPSASIVTPASHTSDAASQRTNPSTNRSPATLGRVGYLPTPG